MKKDKRTRLEGGDWKVGDAAEFLGLSKEEAALVDMKVALARSLRERRRGRGWTQKQLAAAMGSSQPSIVRMEVADRFVTIDLLMKALLTVGATLGDLAKIISASEAQNAA